MKYALGIMACVAIAFTFITSPETSRTHAAPHGSESSDRVTQSMQSMTDELKRLQAQLSRALDYQDQVESRFVALENAPAPEFPEVPDTEELEQRIAKLESRIETLEKQRVTAAYPASSSPTVSYGSSGGTSSSAPVVSYGSTGTPVISTSSTPVVATVNTYTPRWTNYDGLSKRQHAEVYHGVSTAGMTAAQIAMTLDHDHDTFGGGHPPAMRTRSTTVSSLQNCPGGVCPVPSTTRTTTVQSRGGLFGFGVLGRRR